ncbi:MAG: transglutaminase-like domain-containing protein [Planctomycetota bacterium]
MPRATAITSFCLAILLVGLAAGTAGRPPRGPLGREKPRIYDVVVEVQLNTKVQLGALDRMPYNLVDAPIVMPVIFRSTFNRVENESLRGYLWMNGREDKTLAQRTRLDEGFPFGTSLAVIPIARYSGHSLRWQLHYRTQQWSSTIDDAAAQRIAWPKEWPKDVQDGLQPQLYIESNAPIFAKAVEDASQGQLRLVPPYLAAKDLIRYCIRNIRVNGDGVNMGINEQLRSLDMQGALKTVEQGEGTPHDLVCVCIATLRAAGIPARPVIGFRPRPRDRNFRVDVMSWGEFYLPNAGWVPFDPMQLRGNGAMHRKVQQPWIDFGTMERLNERVTLAHHFIPPTAVESPYGPAIWGWDPRPNGDPSSEPIISFSRIDRGQGKEDADE